MAGGWTRDGAIQDQIDDTVTDAVLFARSRIPAGEGETHCRECGEEITAADRDQRAVAVIFHLVQPGVAGGHMREWSHSR